MNIKPHHILYSLFVLLLTESHPVRGMGFESFHDPVAASQTGDCKRGSQREKAFGGRKKQKQTSETLVFSEMSDSDMSRSFRSFEATPAEVLNKYGPLSPEDLSSIQSRFTEATQNTKNRFDAIFTIVFGVDARTLSHSRYAQNALQQVASQFNFLESKGTHYTSPPEYSKDQTQGPQASLGCWEALLIRDYLVRNAGVGDQPLFKDLPNTLYSGGYLNPESLDEDSKEAFLKHIRTNIGQLRILAQTSIPTFSSNKTSLTQVFTAAPHFKQREMPEVGSLNHEISNLLVAAQYRAIAQLAVIKSLDSDQPVNLHLTLVGQGAFHNNSAVLANSLVAVKEVVSGFKVHVFVHSYDKNQDIKHFVNQCFDQPPQIMVADEFFQQ